MGLQVPHNVTSHPLEDGKIFLHMDVCNISALFTDIRAEAVPSMHVHPPTSDWHIAFNEAIQHHKLQIVGQSMNMFRESTGRCIIMYKPVHGAYASHRCRSDQPTRACASVTHS